MNNGFWVIVWLTKRLKAEVTQELELDLILSILKNTKLSNCHHVRYITACQESRIDMEPDVQNRRDIVVHEETWGYVLSCHVFLFIISMQSMSAL